MTPLLERMGAWLVEPAAAVAPVREAPVVARVSAVAPEFAVLAEPGVARALAAVLALRAGRGTVVVGAWPGGRAAGLPATFGARRFARSLAARELSCAAAGRLVTVALPDAAAAERLRGMAGHAPVVFAVAGPRDAEWDRVLADCDLVVVHARAAVVADLTVARLAEQGVAAVRVDHAPGGVARALTRAGLALPGAGLGAPGP
jgi:hypothetical protein